MASVGCGFVAIACFIVSADALDSLLNPFVPSACEDELKPYFYEHASRRRYLGLVFFYAELFFASAVVHPGLGTAEIGIVLAVGYTYWFPTPGLRSRRPVGPVILAAGFAAAAGASFWVDGLYAG